MVEKKIFPFLNKELDRLECYLAGFTGSLEGMLKITVENTLLAEGKRIRPALFFICAKNRSFDIDYLLPAAASIEIVHTASLIHDDIIDESLIRRGKKTIHSIFNKGIAKFVGNYLFTHTFFILNEYNNPQVLEEMSIATQNMVKGEFDQIGTRKNLKQGEEMYFRKINEKTSSLFKVSCALGGILSGSSGKEIENMRKFGQYLGISFQINDDLLDMDAENFSGIIGKPTGNDVRQGNVTLPLIYALEDTRYNSEIKSIFRRKRIGSRDIIRILSIVSETGAIKKTRERLKYYLNQARKIANSVEGRDRKDGLIRVCDFFEQEA
jgi:heptaprenyl diphosphate synthase